MNDAYWKAVAEIDERYKITKSMTRQQVIEVVEKRRKALNELFEKCGKKAGGGFVE